MYVSWRLLELAHPELTLLLLFCQGSRVFIATLGSVFHWKVLAWPELKSSQREETTHLLPSLICFGCDRSTVPAVRSKVSDKGSFHT
jgi:hypothetical protein